MKKNRAILILRNTLSSYVRQVVQIGAFLVLTPFIARKVGTDGYGLWSLIQATVGLFALADLGFSQSVVKFVADARGRQDMERHRTLTSTFFWVYTGLGAAMFLVALGLAPLLPRLLRIPAEHAHGASVVFLLIASRTALAMPLGMFSGVLTGHQQQIWSNGIRSAGTLCYAGLAMWALSCSPSLTLLAWVSFGAQTATNLAAMALCMLKLEGVSISPARFAWGMVWEINTFSWYFFLIQVSSLIYMRVDALIIQAFLSLQAVALYAVASRLAEISSTFCRQLTNALTPMIAELKGAGDEASIRAVFLKGSKLSLALAMPLLAGLYWFAEPLMAAWMGSEFQSAAPACRILMAAMIVSVAYAGAANALTMTGHQRLVAFAFAGGQLLNLALTVALIHWTDLGISGVALATFVSTLVSASVVLRRSARSFHVSEPAFMRQVVWPSVPPCALMLGGLWVVQHWVPPASLWHIAGLEALACVLFAAGFAVLGLDGRERAYYRDRGLRFLRRRSHG